jgi:hypothetical protein
MEPQTRRTRGDSNAKSMTVLVKPGQKGDTGPLYVSGSSGALVFWMVLVILFSIWARIAPVSQVITPFGLRERSSDGVHFCAIERAKDQTGLVPTLADKATKEEKSTLH